MNQNKLNQIYPIKTLSKIKYYYTKLRNKFSFSLQTTTEIGLFIFLTMWFVFLMLINYFLTSGNIVASATMMNTIYEWEGHRATADFMSIITMYMIIYVMCVYKHRVRKPQGILWS